MHENGKRTIGIVGAGALGSYFGIRLAHAGQRVRFLLRSDFSSVRANGMHLTLVDGSEIKLPKVEAFRETGSMGRCDEVIIGLKTTRNGALRELLPPLVGPETVLISLQNGLGNVEWLQQLHPENRVIGALCQIGVNRESPGRIRSFVPRDGSVQIGMPEPNPDAELLHSVAAGWQAAGIHTVVTRSLKEALWRKLMWNIPFNGLTVEAGGKPTNVVCETPALRERARRLMDEVRTVANAIGCEIEPGFTDRMLELTDSLGPYQSSSVLDWLSGRRLEVDAIFRKPLQAGLALGQPMPELKALTGSLERMDRERA